MTDAVPCGFGRALRRSSSGSTAEPRFLTVRTPTSRSRSSAFSFLTLKGSRSVISYAVAYGVGFRVSAVM